MEPNVRCWLTTVLVALAATAAQAEPSVTPVAGEHVWLTVTDPAPGDRQEGPLAWAEVRGWAGSGKTRGHDVVVLLDLSTSTLQPAGSDVDGDRRLARWGARRKPGKKIEHFHDADDTIVAAEMVATRRLLGMVDPDRSRVGLVSFAEEAVLLAPVGSSHVEIARRLESLPDGIGGFTDLAAGLEVSLAALTSANGNGRERSIVVLSDGYPNRPKDERRAAAAARAQAARAADIGVRIHSFGLGLGRVGNEDPYARIASISGGRYVRLDAPGDVVHELPRIDLARIGEVVIENATTRAYGRAVRVFPDGSFDGFVQLSPGENVLLVTATGEAGRVRTELRRVHYTPRKPKSAFEKKAYEESLADLQEELESRALEARLAKEAQDHQRRMRREVDVRVDKPDG